MDVQEHGCFVPAVGAVYLTGVDYGQGAFGDQMVFPCKAEADFSVQGIKEFQLLVPVQREIAAGRGGEPYQDSHRA